MVFECDVHRIEIYGNLCIKFVSNEWVKDGLGKVSFFAAVTDLSYYKNFGWENGFLQEVFDDGR